jgi:hypothetical protein
MPRASGKGWAGMSGQDQIRVLEAELAYWKDKLAAANKRAEVAEAEVDQWRKAIRWRKANDWELRVGVRGTITTVGVVKLRPDGWMAMTDAVDPEFGLPDRNTACAKVCELLGLPVVLP